jgi:hypothetical protein
LGTNSEPNEIVNSKIKKKMPAAVSTSQKISALSLIGGFLLGNLLTNYINVTGLAALLATYGLGRLASDALYNVAALMPGGQAQEQGTDAWISGLSAASSVVGLVIGVKTREHIQQQVASWTEWSALGNYALMALVALVAILRNRSVIFFFRR